MGKTINFKSEQDAKEYLETQNRGTLLRGTRTHKSVKNYNRRDEKRNFRKMINGD